MMFRMNAVGNVHVDGGSMKTVLKTAGSMRQGRSGFVPCVWIYLTDYNLKNNLSALTCGC